MSWNLYCHKCMDEWSFYKSIHSLTLVVYLDWLIIDDRYSEKYEYSTFTRIIGLYFDTLSYYIY